MTKHKTPPTRVIYNNTPRIINTPRGVPLQPGGNEIAEDEWQAWVRWPRVAARRNLERQVRAGNLTGPSIGHNPREKRLPRKLAVSDATGAQLDARKRGRVKRDFLTKGSIDRELLAEVQGRALPAAPARVEIASSRENLEKFAEHVGAVSERLVSTLEQGHVVPVENPVTLIEDPPDEPETAEADDAKEAEPARPRTRARRRRPDPVANLAPEARAALEGRPAGASAGE